MFPNLKNSNQVFKGGINYTNLYIFYKWIGGNEEGELLYIYINGIDKGRYLYIDIIAKYGDLNVRTI